MGHSSLIGNRTRNGFFLGNMGGFGGKSNSLWCLEFSHHKESKTPMLKIQCSLRKLGQDAWGKVKWRRLGAGQCKRRQRPGRGGTWAERGRGGNAAEVQFYFADFVVLKSFFFKQEHNNTFPSIPAGKMSMPEQSKHHSKLHSLLLYTNAPTHVRALVTSPPPILFSIILVSMSSHFPQSALKSWPVSCLSPSLVPHHAQGRTKPSISGKKKMPIV